MIIGHYTSFRHLFAEIARTDLVALTYVPGSPATITRTTGSFVDNGFLERQTIKVIGTADNNSVYVAHSVAALTITLDDDETLVAEGPVDSALVGAFYELDGKEQWPIANVRAGGFTGLDIPRPIVTTPFTITCNAGATDAADGTTYNWYVGQRSPLAADWFWTVTQPDDTKSGTIRFTASDLMVAEFGGGAASLNAERQIQALRKVYVYVQRQSDKAIQFAELYTASNALT